MFDLRLTAAAQADLIAIRDRGLSEFGEAAVTRHLAGFGTVFALLRERPYAGQQRDEFDRDIRSLSHRPHRILYTIDSGGVVIVRILHQAQDVRRALRERT